MQGDLSPWVDGRTMNDKKATSVGRQLFEFYEE